MGCSAVLAVLSSVCVCVPAVRREHTVDACRVQSIRVMSGPHVQHIAELAAHSAACRSCELAG